MSTRVTLRSPGGETVTRDIVDGVWAEPSGSLDLVLGSDSWAIPGLVDAHAHLATSELNWQPGDLAAAMDRATDALGAGVTLLLDKGWRDHTTLELISQVAPDRRPEIEAAGHILAVPGGYYPGFTREIRPGEIAAEVETAARDSAGWVKLIGDWPRKGIGPVANFTEEELGLTVELAAAHGARVAIHTMAREVPSAAVRAGIHSIEHGLFLGSEDLTVLGNRQGMWVPTLLRMEETLSQLGSGSSGGRLIGEGLENVRRLLPLALEAGVAVLAGTDLSVPSSRVAAEALKLADYGLTNEEVLAAASTTGFRVTGRDQSFGVGTPADAVLFGSDPLREIGVLAHPSHVIRKGRMVL